jgi:metal-responsive CopG/Arc/MetJ family transcriptional regulator
MAPKLKGRKKTIVVVSSDRVRVNVDIPLPLFERLSRFLLVERAASSRNALILQAVEEYLNRSEEAKIDDEFARMAEDEQYASLSLRVAEEFVESDWNALQTRISK